MFSNIFTLAYAGIAYVVALANIACIVGFLADFGGRRESTTRHRARSGRRLL